MKYSFYTPLTVDQQIVGSNQPFGELPLVYINSNTAGNIPTIFSIIEGQEYTVENVITGVDEIVSSSSSVTASLISGQMLTIQLIRTAGNWGTVTLDPTTLAFISIVSTVDNVLTLSIDTTASGAGGDYLSVDYDSADYLTSGINQYSGTYEIDILNNAVKEVDLTVSIYPTAQIRSVCPDDVLNFAFFNRQGGWNSIALECKYIKGRDIGRQSTYLTADKVLRKNQIDDVYETYEIRTNSISKIELDLILALRSSIQVYLYNTLSEAWDIPVILDGNSFQTYGNKFNQSETNLSFSFRVAQQVDIQTQ